ncbi:MAG: hypothetical protein WCJ13_09615 [Coriobacteriia bacterium]
MRLRYRTTLAVVAGVAVAALILVVAAVNTSSKAPSLKAGAPVAVPSDKATGESSGATGSSLGVAPQPGLSDANGQSVARSSTGEPPSVPVTTKTPLATVSVPPTRTVALLDTNAADPNSAYAVTFAPYGFGPSGAGRSLVARITQSTALGKPKKVFEFKDQNVVFDITGIPTEKAIGFGGTYEGTVVLIPQSDVLVLSLRDVK